MKIIDKTPSQNEKGGMSMVDRLMGTLQHGLSWYPELNAQIVVVDQLNRVLEKGVVLIRNLTLPGSEIVEPLILIGQGGIYAIYVTHLRGFYEAKGDQWNLMGGKGQSQPASVNLMSRVARLAKALERYLQIHGIQLPTPVEPVLMAADPGMHIDSMRPMVRVVQSDAIKQFAASVLQARPVFSAEYIYDLADRIVTPPEPGSAPQPAPPPVAPQAAPPVPTSENPVSRAHAIFNASEQVQPFNPSDVGFALQSEPAEQPQSVPQHLRESSPSQSLPRSKPRRRGMSFIQIVVLVVIVLVWLCIIAGFGYLILSTK